MGIFDLLLNKNKTVNQPKKEGYLGFYGLWEWYDSQPKEVQDFLYKSCGYGINTDSSNLFEGDHEIYGHNPDEPGIPSLDTATQFLCRHAVTAVGERNHAVCKILLDGAFKSAKSKSDSFYYAAVEKNIRETMKYSPDQKEIDSYKPVLYQLIKENPGILQSELKNRFPPELENIVGLAHWSNVQEGKIKREKKGRSFQLWAE